MESNSCSVNISPIKIESKKENKDSTKSDSYYHLRRKRKKSLSDSFVYDISDEVIEEKVERKSSNHIATNIKNIKTMSINGKIVYATKNNQIEIKGNWSSNNEPIFNSTNKIEFLHKTTNKILFPIPKKDVDMSNLMESIEENNSSDNDFFMLNINKRTLYSLLLIPNIDLFKHILYYLGGKYAGFFKSEDIVKLDEAFINYNYEEKYQKIIVNGSGEDDIGKYTISGNAELFTTPTLMIAKNTNENCNKYINLGELNINKYYFYYNLE